MPWHITNNAFNEIGNTMANQSKDFETLAKTCLIMMGAFVLWGCVEAARELLEEENSEE